MFTMPIAKLKLKLVLPHSIINVLYFYMYQILLQPCTLHLLGLITRRKMEGNDEYFTLIFYSMKIVKFDCLSFFRRAWILNK